MSKTGQPKQVVRLPEPVIHDAVEYTTVPVIVGRKDDYGKTPIVEEQSVLLRRKDDPLRAYKLLERTSRIIDDYGYPGFLGVVLNKRVQR